jgi:NADH-quinone oxidoreductase subunit M
MAAVYMLRAYIKAMHGPDENGVEQREMSFAEALPILPAVVVVLGLALYPQIVLKHTEGATTASVMQAAYSAGINPVASEAKR